MSSDPASNQLPDYKKQNKGMERLTLADGAPIGNKLASLTAGPRGPILLADVNLVEELQTFDRERIPERVVHAKGAGAFGYFEVTHDITKYTKAKVFAQVGKRTPIAIRFSTVGGESGSADTVRDPRGFAVKFYTEDGNWDLVGNNTPVFFVRDPILFPSFIHTQKRNPATHLKDPNMVWDFQSLRPETLHQFMILFSDRGIPDGYRAMNGYGSHTFKLVNAKNESVYCKFHMKTAQGIKNLPVDKAATISAQDPDYSIRDLYNAISKGDYPKWNFFIQVMTFEQAEKYRFNPFDVTKVWSHKEFPLIPVGQLVLDRNPTNYFAEVEQLAFAPSHLVPGVETSPDKMLQGRIFSYADTHRHRLGPNYQQIPVNCPYRSAVRNYQRDGLMNVTPNQGGAPNYYPNSFSGPEQEASREPPAYPASGDVARYNTGDDDNFTQPGIFWREVLNKAERERLVSNIVGNLKEAADFIQERAVKNFCQVDPEFGRGVADGLRKQGSHISAKI
ncbi:hypothetical protein ONE63_009635 [Megalurothrips usitatus]|uniref:Catalase n=1 Tax=Megalurothrips usitatus TaxID=439358 RepID=A0AAV7XFA6_9NEOP|nr:hypothetical protein ONE63_009635 [Megalurothrips usitatus]